MQSLEFDNNLKDYLDGEAGQKIEVYDNYCVINTSSSFDGNMKAQTYSMLINQTKPQEGYFDKKENQDAIIESVFRKGIIKTGVKALVATGIDSMKSTGVLSKTMFSVIPGPREIMYRDFEKVEFMQIGSIGTGYLRFQSKESILNPTLDVLFFFGGMNFLNRKKLNNKMEKIYETISYQLEKAKKIRAEEEKAKPIERSEQTEFEVLHDDKFETIKKYKVLLDEGILTQDEFNTKKKEILGL